MSRAASASPLLLAISGRNADDYLEVNHCLQPYYNTLPSAGEASTSRRQQQPHWSGGCPSIYSTTDPHYLSGVASSVAASALLGCPSECDVTLPADASWSSDHLYCNMASVDPLPSLPPRISRRCHSVINSVFYISNFQAI